MSLFAAWAICEQKARAHHGWVGRQRRGQAKRLCVPSLFPDTRLPRAARSLARNGIGSDIQDKLRSDHPNIQFEL